MASDEGAEFGRRHFLTVATAVTGGIGAAFVAVPFLGSFKPSARAQALGAPVEVDISKLENGAMLTVEWRGKPIYIVNRPAAALETLNTVADRLRDPESEVPQQPDYAKNQHRSVRPDIFVALGVCTHLGCAPMFRPDVAPADLGADWPGGFFCPCHGSKFDFAGRVYAGVPAPSNLVVPPYRFLDDSTLLVGDDQGVA
ncbi:MAG: ubiquinol-cytochrome c reductase iron-sulfur subunit [Pseudomonadota bacterium]